VRASKPSTEGIRERVLGLVVIVGMVFPGLAASRAIWTWTGLWMRTCERSGPYHSADGLTRMGADPLPPNTHVFPQLPTAKLCDIL
jgi:hypothetical protein